MMMIIKPLPIEMPIDIPIYIPIDIPSDIPIDIPRTPGIVKGNNPLSLVWFK